MGLSQATRELLAYKWYVECLGRKPSTDDRLLRAREIAEKGPAWVYATLYESTEAADFRAKRGW